jgi:hypothetical protein
VWRKKAGQVVWLPEPSFEEEVIVLSNVITNLPAYITTAAFLYHSVARLCIRMYFHIIITPKPENDLYI